VLVSQYLALADQAALRIIEYARGTSGSNFPCLILQLSSCSDCVSLQPMDGSSLINAMG
jgi:hypothetical protein